MASSKDETKVPKAYENPKSNDLKLYNNKWLKSLKIGCWSNDHDANFIGKSFVVDFHDTLWYIDGHWETSD